MCRRRSMTYRQAAEWLEALANPERSGLGPRFARRMDLEATLRMMALLGDPHQGLRAVHVAGTKGKGSVSAMIESAARAAGHSTALFTSPHLVSWRERVRLDGAPVSETTIARLASRVRPVVEQVEAEGLRRPSFFEACAAIAFLAFAEAAPDLCVIEVGLGGRLDATNVITPLLAVITTLGLDHTRVLGDTIELIAAEKSGIVKPGVPVVLAPQPQGAAAVVAEIAAERGAPLLSATGFTVGEVTPLDPDDVAPGELPAIREPMGGDYAGTPVHVSLPLPGAHQAINVGVAAAACTALRELGLGISAAEFTRGLEAVRWPARVEITEAHPWVIADCAHNGQSARALMAAMRRHLVFERLIVVLGVSKDKAAGDIAHELADAHHAILTRASLPRALSTAKLTERTGASWRSFETIEEPVAALARARELAGPRDAICVTGSLFVISDLVEAGALRLRFADAQNSAGAMS